MRNFGIPRETARPAIGGNQLAGPRYRAGTLRSSLPPLPSRSLVKPPEFSEPQVHKFQAFESALFVFTTAAALVVGLVLLFVDV